MALGHYSNLMQTKSFDLNLPESEVTAETWLDLHQAKLLQNSFAGQKLSG